MSTSKTPKNDPRVDIPQPFKVLPHEALVNVWWTGTLMKRMARRFFRSTDLSEAEFNLLVVLRHAPHDLSQSDLSERLLVDKSNVTGLIDRLESSGLIRRRPDPDDRRRYHVVLTTAGRRQIDAVDPIYHQMVGEVMSELSETECRTLVRLTRKLRRGLATVEDDLDS